MRRVLAAATATSPRTARARRLDTLTIEQVNGAFVYGTRVGRALRDAGFVESPRGLTLRRSRRATRRSQARAAEGRRRA